MICPAFPLFLILIIDLECKNFANFSRLAELRVVLWIWMCANIGCTLRNAQIENSLQQWKFESESPKCMQISKCGESSEKKQEFRWCASSFIILKTLAFKCWQKFMRFRIFGWKIARGREMTEIFRHCKQMCPAKRIVSTDWKWDV